MRGNFASVAEDMRKELNAIYAETEAQHLFIRIYPRYYRCLARDHATETTVVRRSCDTITDSHSDCVGRGAAGCYTRSTLVAR